MTTQTMDEEAPGQRFREPWERAVAGLEATLRERPDDVASLVALADFLVALWCFGFIARAEVFERARAAARRAVELDAANGEAQATLGMIHLSDWEWASAEAAFRRGVALAPESPKCHHWLGLFSAAMGRHAEAVACAERSVELEREHSYRTGLGTALYFAHDFERMARVMEDAVARQPESAPAHDWLGMAYVQLERFDESIAVYRRAVELSGGAAEIRAGLGHAYGMAGREDEARAELATLHEQAQRWYVPPVQIAFVHAGLGEHDAAFALLEEAYTIKAWELAFIREEPWFDHAHEEPRFRDLLRRLAFPPRP